MYQGIRDFLECESEPNYRFNQILTSVFDQRIGKFAHMTALPVSLRKKLEDEFGDSILRLAPISIDESSQVTKVLFALPDNNRVEAVGMRYQESWNSYCISTQSGCGLACPFCATGRIGLKRNLNAGEIVEQVLFFHLRGEKIDSVSFMGMGEPLANPELFDSLNLLTNTNYLGMGQRRLTISTVGVIPGIVRLSSEYPQVNLTFSLHTAFSNQRDILVPLNKIYPMEDVFDVLDEHIKKTNRKVYLAYTLLKSINDSADHARVLIDLIKSRTAPTNLYHVNLISYNLAQNVLGEFQSPDPKTRDEFYFRLKNAGIQSTVRHQFGTSIDAACGQLYAEYSHGESKSDVRATGIYRA